VMQLAARCDGCVAVGLSQTFNALSPWALARMSRTVSNSS
jgi:hypothetical protein